MTLRHIFTMIRAYYDKLIAFVVLLGLLASLVDLGVRVGMDRGKRRESDEEIDSMTPKHEHAKAVDTTAFVQIGDSIRVPFQISYAEWTGSVFIPETRVRCADCRRPIPFNARRCPFCEVEQPMDKWDRPDYDGDEDGMWDQWEKKYQLDPFDPRDAVADADNDGFSNITEFRADPGTDPLDPKSYPPPEAELRLVKIVADPFKLRFKSVMRLPDGTPNFQINLKDNRRTYFKKLGEDVSGFRLSKYEPKSEERVVPGIGKRVVDSSVLTLQRGDKEIPLVIGKNVQYNEYGAELFFALDNSVYSVKINDVFELKGQEYSLIEIDSVEEKIVIHRLRDGKKIVIRRFSEYEQER